MMILSYYTPSFAELASVTLPTVSEYAARRGYSHVTCVGSAAEENSKYGFRKTDIALAMLRGTDVLWVLDVDAIITNHTVRLEDFLDHNYFYGTHDANGFNAGSYLIRNTDEGQNFLNEVLNSEPFFAGEQPAMETALANKTGIFGKMLPQCSINSYLYEEYGQQRSHAEGQWQPGDLVLHLPGCTNQRRIEIFTRPYFKENTIR